MPNLDIEPRILHEFCLMQHMPFQAVPASLVRGMYWEGFSEALVGITYLSVFQEVRKFFQAGVPTAKCITRDSRGGFNPKPSLQATKAA